MSGRRFELLSTGQIYHVFNRSIANEEILNKNRLLHRAIDLIDYYSYPQRLRYSFFKRLPIKLKNNYIKEFKKRQPLISIYAFALMPNHYHLMIRQLSDDGIKLFISNFQNGFAKYLNLLNHRNGSVFQKPFKAKRITDDLQFLHLGRYIHLNPVTSYFIEMKDLQSYPWTSYPNLLNKINNSFVDSQITLNMIGTTFKYKKFIENQYDYQRKLNLIKHLTFD